MSRVLVILSETDEVAMGRVQGKLQTLSPKRSLTRPDVVRLLVAAYAAGVWPETLLEGAKEDGG
jgi:hypothetical protein